LKYKVENMAEAKFKVGDSLLIIGKFVGKVLKVYPNFATASAQYERSYQTICKVGAKFSETAPAYLCEIMNKTRAHIGTTEDDAVLQK